MLTHLGPPSCRCHTSASYARSPGLFWSPTSRLGAHPTTLHDEEPLKPLDSPVLYTGRRATAVSLVLSHCVATDVSEFDDPEVPRADMARAYLVEDTVGPHFAL